MTEILDKIIANPTTVYLLSFAGLGAVLTLALNAAHSRFTLTERTWGLVTLGAGALGGFLMQSTGLVALPGPHNWVSAVLPAFCGAAVAMAATGFSAVDLRAIVKKSDV